MKKPILAIILLALLLCGCGNSVKEAPLANNTPVITEVPASPQPTQAPTATPTIAPTEAPTPEPTDTPTPEPTAEPAVVATDAPAHAPDMEPNTTDSSFSDAETSTMDDWYQHMLNTSILSVGTNGRLEKFIDKLEKDEPVSIVAFGGSITEGAGAENFTYSYGDQFINSLLEKYPLTGSTYHNSGLGGTPSTLGLMRYERDVTDILGNAPDLVIIEFAVNDYQEPTDGRAYESLVRTILERDEDTAVILLFSVFESKWNLQADYIPIGEHYGLPMVSIKDAIATAYAGGHLTDAEYFADIYHPTNYGHEIMADCLTELFDRVAAKDTPAIMPLPETSVYGTDFMNMQLITSQDSAGATVTTGSFTGQDKSLQTFARTAQAGFPDNWMHTFEGGNESLKIELTCKNILLSYKFSNASDFGKASVYIDDNLVTELSGYVNGGWNNTETVLILDEDTASPHTLEIKMSEGQEDKKFSVLGIGYTQ
ncbi:MAG: SGNH/GDSL hydrolase family protein [Lachnospiraceae bacterium]|nr:SGNH/GDSL hydrolase family protein [Lachnospiraceae bacterium]MBQ7777082.1 SGNH/GDSL hydrolase family protein [Lachnospiraceae bacterium]